MTIIVPMVAFADIKSFISVLYILVIVFTISIIILEKKEPVKALAWITVIALLPVAGLILYIMFGRNFRKEKIFNRKEIEDLKEIELLGQKQLDAIKDLDNLAVKEDIVENKDIITLLLNNSKSILTANNKIKILNDGREKFPALLEALKNAKSSIHIEYYIFENDRIGSQIAEVMMSKAREGVEVRFIYDDVGSWGLSRTFIRELRKAGVQTGCFMPVAFPWFTSKVNYRNHRKIVVVDGSIGFTGGLNIADRYLYKGKKGIWRDTHLQIQGEGVKALQSVFAIDWYFLNGRTSILNAQKYFPEPEVEGDVAVQIASSGPDSDWATIMQAFFAAITRAEKHIYISSPYFLPNQAVLTALKVAALSGIDVKVLIPSKSDSKIVYWATRSYISELLEAGIEIYLYRKGFNHSKVIMIDSKFSSVGTANMDVRSFEDNFEVSAFIYDRNTAIELEGYFFIDLEDSIKVTKHMWDRRSKFNSIYESISRLASPLL